MKGKGKMGKSCSKIPVAVKTEVIKKGAERKFCSKIPVAVKTEVGKKGAEKLPENNTFYCDLTPDAKQYKEHIDEKYPSHFKENGKIKNPKKGRKFPTKELNRVVYVELSPDAKLYKQYIDAKYPSCLPSYIPPSCLHINFL